MTEKQEKYIIKKYSFFWNGVYASKFIWNPHAMPCEQKLFAKYINNSKKMFALKEREKIPQLLTNKSYVNFREYNAILSKACFYEKEKAGTRNINFIKYILYFAKSKVSFNDFEKYTPFCFTLSNSLVRNKNIVNAEKSINTIIEDAMLVYEIVRPDIIYNACLTKDMVLLKNNFNRINQILLKYNKYVYNCSRKSNVIKYINPTKTKQFKYFIKLLIKNGYVKYDKTRTFIIINTEVICKSTFSSLCYSFMQKLHFYNSEIFKKKICEFFNVQNIIDTKQKCPRKLQLIFDAVRKYDNEITNQQKVNK